MVLLGVFAIFSRVVKPPFSIPSTVCLLDFVDIVFGWPMSIIVIPKRIEPVKLYLIKIKFDTFSFI